ncbi:MAG: MFS transporter [Demequinaceae bacterium]|nr:MFS transporter [Demequinaceae bacterium]
MSTTTPDAGRVQSGRRALLVLFGILGLLTTTFLSRMPSLRDLMHVTPAGLAMLLLSGAMGALVALTVTGWATARFGTRALLWWSSFGYLVAFCGVGVASALGSPMLFVTAYFFVSVTFALSNVPINAEAAEIERRVGRSIMSQFHAAFSVGMALGLAVGVAASHWGIEPAWHFAIVAAAATAVRLAMIPMAVIDGTPDARVASKSLGGPFATAGVEFRNKRVLLIGAIVFAAAMTENVAAQWLPLSIVDDFGKREALGDIIYWVFVVSMFTVRMSGAGVIDRLGRVVTLRASAVLVVIGVVLFATTPVFWLVPVAALLWGVGAALNYPIGFSAAADDPRHAAARVAAVSTFSTVAGLMVPQAVGRLAEWVPLRHAMLLVVIGSIASFVFSRSVRGENRVFKSRRADAAAVGSATLGRKRKEPVGDPAAVIDAAGVATPMHQQK